MDLPGRPLLGLVHVVVVVVLLVGSEVPSGPASSPPLLAPSLMLLPRLQPSRLDAPKCLLTLILGHELLSSGEDDQAPPAPPRSPLATPPKSELAPPGGARASDAAAGAAAVAAVLAVFTAWWRTPHALQNTVSGVKASPQPQVRAMATTRVPSAARP